MGYTVSNSKDFLTAKASGESLKQLMLLTRQIFAPDRKRGGDWDATFSPAIAKKCRFLGRSPTDAVLSDL